MFPHHHRHSVCWFIAAIIFLQTVFSHPKYQVLIPNGGSVPNWPAVGHIGPNGAGVSGKPRNAFGHDFSQEGKTWTLNLCEMDSDADGRTNGEELGDPDCIWKKGDIPSRTTDITNPGIKNDFHKPNHTETTSKEGNSTTNNTEEDHPEGFEAWVIVHVFLMASSFGFLLPCATLIPFYCRSYRQTQWRDDHIRVMTISSALGTLGFIIAFAAEGVQRNVHGILGLLIMIAFCIQIVGGYARNKLPSRQAWKKGHSFAGRCLLIGIAFQVFFGYLLLLEQASLGILAFGFFHSAAIVSVFFLVRRGMNKIGFESLEEGIEEVPLPTKDVTIEPNVRTLT